MVTEGHSRHPQRFQARAKAYVREGKEEDEKRIKALQARTVRSGTLTGDGPVTRKVDDELVDIPASRAYDIMHALARHFNCEVTPK